VEEEKDGEYCNDEEGAEVVVEEKDEEVEAVVRDMDKEVEAVVGDMDEKHILWPKESEE